MEETVKNAIEDSSSINLDRKSDFYKKRGVETIFTALLELSDDDFA